MLWYHQILSEKVQVMVELRLVMAADQLNTTHVLRSHKMTDFCAKLHELIPQWTALSTTYIGNCVIRPVGRICHSVWFQIVMAGSVYKTEIL